jgi:CSLREA domain-containing protein
MLRLLLLLLFLPLLPATSARADVTIVVNTTADTTALDGACSLREAIIAANGDFDFYECAGNGGGYDRIEFALGPGTPTIDVVGVLPEIASPVEIDGGPTRVELRGTGTEIGLDILAAGAGSLVRQLVLRDFAVGIRLDSTSNVVLVGNRIGTDASGEETAADLTGIALNASDAWIGGPSGLSPNGPCTGDCNLISGHTANGVVLSNGSSAQILGNYIGTTVSGTGPLGNATGIRIDRSRATIGRPGAGNLVSSNGAGIVILANANDALGSVVQSNRVGCDATGTSALGNGVGISVSLSNRTYPVTIGGAAAGEGNSISGNFGDGILLITADRVRIFGNRIGTRADGLAPLPNTGAGVRLSSSTHQNVIGGVLPGQGNHIAWNATGVHVGINNYYNTVRGNSIHDNLGKGIQLDDGQANMAPAPPTLFGGNPVSGTSFCYFCFVDIYSDDADEGRTWEGSAQVDEWGSFTFFGAANGPYITATTTGPDGSTSEFSFQVPYDRDADGTFDPFDNCTLVSNPSQLDADDDGYGNLCDGDLNNSSGLVNAVDLSIFRQRLGTVNPVADLNGSGGVVNATDLAIFRALLGKPPGPSGLHP